MIERYLNLNALVESKSAFLFGPRSTGKSFLIRHQLGSYTYINLLRSVERRRYIENPSLLEQVAASDPSGLIIIDEIQLIPELLDEVHHLIETTDCRFLLTGSSARKLKRTGANMLGGRARKMSFHPLCWYELKNEDKFNLYRYLLYGGIPDIYLSENPEDELGDYIDTYLDHEIKAEAVSRNIFGFEQFFRKAAYASGETVNYSNIASDAQISAPTVRHYYEILEDTLLGFYLRPYQGAKRKAIQSAKFYLFDLGVMWYLAGVKQLPEKSDLWGKAFESFIVTEIHSLNNYKRLGWDLRFWRTTHQDEVDLIIDEDFAIEIKSADKVSYKHWRNLEKIREEGFSGRLILLSRDPIKRHSGEIELWPYDEFLDYLWSL